MRYLFTLLFSMVLVLGAFSQALTIDTTFKPFIDIRCCGASAGSISDIWENSTSGAVRLENAEILGHISVYNLQGQKVQEINPQERSWELPKENGLYFVRLEDKEGNYYSKKIIKN